MFNRTRLAAAVSAACGAGLIAAITPATLLAQTTMDRVEITGSSIKRIEGETALPVQVLTREDIQKTGATNVEQLMQTVSSNASSGQLIGASASGATTLGLSSVSLRGLNSTRTLVLINGRRISPYGYGFTNDSVSVDVNGIPLEAIDRVEILKDGASAIYGSDAIAGVVNFILRRDFKGLEVAADYGQARQGSAATAKATLSYGIGDLAKDRFNFMITGSYQRERALFGRDRSFADSSINVDALNDVTSGNTFPANIFPVDGSFGTRNPSFPGCPGPYATRSPLFDLIGSQGCRFDPAPMVTLIPKTERYGAFANFKFDITPQMQFFTEASYYRNRQDVLIQPTPISDQFTIPLNNPLANQFPYNAFVGGAPLPPGQVSPIPYSTILLTSASPFYPTAFVQGQTGGATPDLLIRWRANLTGNRDLTDTSKATRLATGLRGTAGSWDYDGAFLYSASNVTERVNDGFAILSQTLPILNSGNVDFFGNGTTAPTLAALEAAEFHGQTLETKTSLMSIGGKASSDLATLPGGPLSLAVGAELRRENYELDPASVMVAGDLSGYGGNFVPVDKSRNVQGVFTEVNARLLQSLEVNGAVRFDHYGGVGSSTTPKLGIRYTPVREVLLRGSAGKGFRAPSLLDLHAPPTTGVSPAGLSDPERCPTTGSGLDCVTQFPITNGGNPNLKPEKSRNLTAGMVLEPTNNISVALDYFWISLKDTITQNVPAATILADTALYASLITRGAPQGGLPGPIVDINQTNINLGRTDLSGWDLDVKISSGATPYGRFTLFGNGTYLSKYDVQNPDGSFTSALDTANGSTGGVTVRWRHFAGITWQAGAWSTSFTQQYQKQYTDLPGSFEDTDPTIFIPRKVSAYQIFGLSTTYTGLKGLTATFGIRNLFDKEPPYSNQFAQFQSGYDATYGDPRGRFLYTRIA
jgi:iron complex outermembrane receptor protein